LTDLLSDDIFLPANLQTIRQLLEACAPLHSFAPFKGFRRIIVVLLDDESALAIKDAIDGKKILGSTVKVYFGQHTPIEQRDQHLHAPQSDKQFFISPPPSPPHGWEIQNEGPPNKDVMPDDLAEALAKLSASSAQKFYANPTADIMDVDGQSERHQDLSPVSPTADGENRKRSGSATIVFDPEMHSIPGSPNNLPCISVEDVSADEGEPLHESDVKPIKAHTARPPVELM
jgi:hypothetical protein